MAVLNAIFIRRVKQAVQEGPFLSIKIVPQASSCVIKHASWECTRALPGGAVKKGGGAKEDLGIAVAGGKAAGQSLPVLLAEIALIIARILAFVEQRGMKSLQHATAQL